MKFKKIILTGSAATILAVVPAIGAISCGTSDEMGDKDIAMIVSTKNNPYFVTLLDSAKSEAKKKGYKLHEYVSKNDQQVEASLIDTIITQGFKTLILNGLDASQSAAAAKKAIDAGIKVIALDRKLDAAAKVFTTISSANQKGAQDLTKIVADIIKNADSSGFPTTKILHLQGLTGEQNGIDRWNGAKTALTTAGWRGDSALVEARADYDRTKGNTKTSEHASQSIKWIIADNDEMALGAVSSLGEKAKSAITFASGSYTYDASKVIITGFDANDDAKAAVKGGTMFGTVAQDPVQMAITAVHAAIEAGGGEDFTAITKGTATLVPVELIYVGKAT